MGIKWISVNERLPDDDQECLVFNGSKVLMAVFIVDDLKAENSSFQVQKYPTAGERTFIMYWTGVTHWTPLPEPPEKVLKEDKTNG
jgi:hypothetical protein